MAGRESPELDYGAVTRPAVAGLAVRPAAANEYQDKRMPGQRHPRAHEKRAH